MAKPSKRKWAVQKRETRILANQERAQRVADRLLGKRTLSRDEDIYQQWLALNHKYAQKHYRNK